MTMGGASVKAVVISRLCFVLSVCPCVNGLLENCLLRILRVPYALLSVTNLHPTRLLIFVSHVGLLINIFSSLVPSFKSYL